ncbi:hypothetical protein IFU40_13355 [Microbacterium sp. CFBP 13617]|uniref:hypothetical protein n=1 Tax=Microbacterium sp. CFBP 13617 TaxID=2774035 RepID=UPI00177BF8E3|nr:hypothetical protein [Microbacterium sp. CFBP 13617]MBD8219620.1 hypothetical protein [Microbacterium sp. CFBP 13617]
MSGDKERRRDRRDRTNRDRRPTPWILSLASFIGTNLNSGGWALIAAFVTALVVLIMYVVYLVNLRAARRRP